MLGLSIRFRGRRRGYCAGRWRLLRRWCGRNRRPSRRCHGGHGRRCRRSWRRVRDNRLIGADSYGANAFGVRRYHAAANRRQCCVGLVLRRRECCSAFVIDGNWLLFARNQLFAQPALVHSIGDQLGRLRVTPGGRHNFTRCRLGFDDRRRRARARFAEKCPIAERAGRTDHRQAQYSSDKQNARPLPFRSHVLIEIVVLGGVLGLIRMVTFGPVTDILMLRRYRIAVLIARDPR